MNNFSFTGNLGKDAEKRVLPDGTAIVSMSVPCKSGFGDKAVTTWLRCTMFGKRGESVYQYLTKGTLVGITGEFSAREYADKDGVNRMSLEVRVNDLTLLGGKREPQSHEYQRPEEMATPSRATQPAPSSQAPRPSSGFDDFDSDITF